MAPDVGKVTQLLKEAREGSEGAVHELLPIIYDELRRLANQSLGGNQAAPTLQPTALVHEAYLCLMGRKQIHDFQDRLHFFRVAARAMRNVLVNHVRDKVRLKRGGDRMRLTLMDVDSSEERDAVDLLALDEALGQLAKNDEDLARIVELRFFSGLTIAETAELLAISTPTVERRWRLARAFLARAMVGEQGE
jgi:RNA polymerase sigma factor (TIGR02999 family)